MLGAAVWDVIAVDTGEDDVAHAPVRNGAGRALRLRVVRRSGRARRVHRTEAAAPRACVACEHSNRVPICLGPGTLLNVHNRRSSKEAEGLAEKSNSIGSWNSQCNAVASTRPDVGLTQEHDGGCARAAIPALPDVWTLCFLTHGV